MNSSFSDPKSRCEIVSVARVHACSYSLYEGAPRATRAVGRIGAAAKRAFEDDGVRGSVEGIANKA